MFIGCEDQSVDIKDLCCFLIYEGKRDVISITSSMDGFNLRVYCVEGYRDGYVPVAIPKINALLDVSDYVLALKHHFHTYISFRPFRQTFLYHPFLWCLPSLGLNADIIY
jgi:hypothetical protein